MRTQIFAFIMVAACFNFSALQPTIKCPSIFSCLFNWNKKTKTTPKNPSSVELSELFFDANSSKRKTDANNLPTEQDAQTRSSKIATQSKETRNHVQSPIGVDQQLFQSSLVRNFKKESDSSSDNEAPPAPTPSPDATPIDQFTKQDSSSPWGNIEDVL